MGCRLCATHTPTAQGLGGLCRGVDMELNLVTNMRVVCGMVQPCRTNSRTADSILIANRSDSGAPGASTGRSSGRSHASDVGRIGPTDKSRQAPRPPELTWALYPAPEQTIFGRPGLRLSGLLGYR